MGRKILSWARAEGVAVIGLTATPRCPTTSRYRVAYSVEFAELVRLGHVARPHPEEIQTGIHWAPRKSRRSNDFALTSIEELGRNAQRNKFIVEQLVDNRKRYGKTILFACDVRHAKELAKKLCARGLQAAAIHSQQPRRTNWEQMREFEHGELEVLVNVAMATHGIDIPQTSTVAIARPTLSDILYSQMVGRGARVHVPTGKRSFQVVDFTDNLGRFEKMLVTAWGFYSGSPRSVRRCPPRVEHTFETSTEGRIIPAGESVPELLHGLWYRQGQTFGIEAEMLGGERRAICWALTHALGLERVAPERPSSSSFKRWVVGSDLSAQWEVRSRILEGQAGYEELAVALGALDGQRDELGLRINHRAGLHVHIGWAPRNHYELKRLVRLVKLFEPALGTIVAPSRIRSFDGERYGRGANRYCAPVNRSFPRRKMGTISSMSRAQSFIDDRFRSVNLRSLEVLGTVEVRIHSGTLDPAKVLPWLSLWQQILWAASEGERVPKRLRCRDDCTRIIPDGDIIALARRYLPGGEEPMFLERLRLRREQVLKTWKNNPQLRSWPRFASTWTT